MAIVAIATQVGLSEKTLTKYYSRELEKGPDLARGRVLEAMYAKAMDGNVTAQRAFLAMTEAGMARQASKSIGRRGDQAAEPPPEKLGLKEQRQRAAGKVTGKYSPPAGPPTLVVSNPR